MKKQWIKLATTALIVGSVSSAQAQCESDQRLFEHAGGESCIPVTPERIAAPRGDSVATPLIDIGAPVIAVGFRGMEDGSKYVRGASDIFGQQAVDALDLIDLGNPNQFDFEVLAAASPDLIILTSWQADMRDQASNIAPTIVMAANAPFLDHLSFLADAAGLADTYDNKLSAYQARIEAARQSIGNPGEITVSRFDLWEDGLWYYPNWGAVDQVINDIGFAKPEIQANATESLSGLSFEEIHKFDGDVLISSTAPRFGQTITMLEDQWDAAAPFWRQVSGVAAGNQYWYPRDIWVGYTFASLEKAIEGLELITAGRSFE